jgi:glycosyltransferase involved in cell wall biosynthesis
MGHKCIAIRQSDRNYETKIQGIKFVNIATKGPKMAGSACFPKAINYILKNDLRPDVVVFQSYFIAPLFDWKLTRKGIKVCYVQHSFACDNPKNKFLVKAVERIIERFTAIWAKNIITVGSNMAALVEKRLGVKPSIVRGGIFMPPEETSTSNILERFDLKPDNFFLTIARIDPVKNLHILINGFKKYKGEKSLVIGGNINNPYGKQLDELSQKDHRIKLVGPLLGADKDVMLRNCFAYCMVSYSEGFPISLLEAMSYGKRCIASDITPNVEALSNELGVWCKVNSEDDITKALTMTEVDNNRKDLEVKIRDRVASRFTWEASANSFLKYVNTL